MDPVKNMLAARTSTGPAPALLHKVVTFQSDEVDLQQNLKAKRAALIQALESKRSVSITI